VQDDRFVVEVEPQAERVFLQLQVSRQRQSVWGRRQARQVGSR
jgi:hypothetical protein